MTEPKVVVLRPEEWKQQVLLNLAQLQSYIVSVPGMMETGLPPAMGEHFAVFDEQVNRARTFMYAWSKSRFDAVPTQPVPDPVQTNGAHVKRKGGWPKGRPRKPKPQEMTQ